ncbi:hypothetical protein [Paenibacillus sinopodophylli]|uniref:hypothetical protein n=1 Tax=Paenibacillus sinopodophylli TaxID=1837342 RepID=UPI00110CD604|nr:hypothetical protein [Paenibacillus sinopodophylli]
MELKMKPLKHSFSQTELYYLIAIALFVVINIAGLFVYVLPERDRLKLAKQDIVQFSSMLQSVQNEYADEKIPDDLINKLTTRVPTERVDSANLIFFHELADVSQAPLAFVKQSSGMGEEQNTSDSSVSANGTMTTNFEVTVVGHLPSLLQFIDNLHNYSRLYNLQKWSMTELSKETINQEYPDLYSHSYIKKDTAVLSMNMTIQSYVFPQFADAFKQESKVEELPDKAV